MTKGLFAVVAGPRLGGKTTLAGTAPGKTLLLQAGVLETGSRSAAARAKKDGNELRVETFSNLIELRSWMDKVSSGKEECDNLYVDGLSAITEMKFKQADIQKAISKNGFEGYRKLGEDAVDIILELKSLTVGAHAVNVFVTCATKMGQEKAGPVDVQLESKGQMAVTSITRLGEAVISVLNVPTAEGPKKRVLIIKEGFYESWPGRIDGLLDEDNPGFCDPDLKLILSYAGY